MRKADAGIKTFRVRGSFRWFRESCMQIGWFATAPHRGSSLFAPVFAAAGREGRKNRDERKEVGA